MKLPKENSLILVRNPQLKDLMFKNKAPEHIVRVLSRTNEYKLDARVLYMIVQCSAILIDEFSLYLLNSVLSILKRTWSGITSTSIEGRLVLRFFERN